MPAGLAAPDALSERITALGPWFHNLTLRGQQTAPDHFLGDFPANFFRFFAHALPADLAGASVLDIGCNGGFYSLEMKRRGAGRVLGIDSDARYLSQAALAAEVTGHAIELRQMSVYDIPALRERFDIVLFMGVFYHLRYPLLALDLIREHVARGMLVFQTMQRGSRSIEPMQPDYPFDEQRIFASDGAPRMHFIEHSYAGDPTNWWIPNAACVEAMLRSANFEIRATPDTEVYICQVS